MLEPIEMEKLKATLPTVHLNGTGREALVEARREACDALRAAEEALGAVAPNARDYYTRADYPACFERARELHVARAALLVRLREELTAEARLLMRGGA